MEVRKDNPPRNVFLTGGPTFELLHENRRTVDQIAGYLTLDDTQAMFSFRNHGTYAKLLENLYDSTEHGEINELMGVHPYGDNSERYLSDIHIWKELRVMAESGFNDRLMQRRGTGRVFLRDVDKMTRPAKLFGATLAAQWIFGPNKFDRESNRDEILERMAEAMSLSEEETIDIVRVLAKSPVSDTQRKYMVESDRILLEACRQPQGLVHRAISDHDDRIDLSYFEDDSILFFNVSKALEVLIDYKPHDRDLIERGQDHRLLRANFPDEVTEIEQHPNFLQGVLEQLRHRTYEFAGDRRAKEFRSSLIPPEEVLGVVGKDAWVVIAESVCKEIESWIPTIRKPRVASEVEAMLRGIGPDYVKKTARRAVRGVKRIKEAINQ